MSILYKSPYKTGSYGSDAEILAALLIDLPVWGANCSKMSSILKKNYVLMSIRVYI